MSINFKCKCCERFFDYDKRFRLIEALCESCGKYFFKHFAHISKDRIELLYSKEFRDFAFKLKRKFGGKIQRTIAIEELAELIQVLAKSERALVFPKNDKLIEEIADCYLMLRQLEIMYAISNDVDKQIKLKIIRTNERCELDE